MPSLTENLATLKQNAEGLERLELYGDGYAPDWVVENRTGSTASLRIYYEVAVEFGGIGPSAARRALELYGEKVEEARAEPGRHPNIDRLLQIIEQDLHYSVRAVPRG
jgi:hypothetical protein